MLSEYLTMCCTQNARFISSGQARPTVRDGVFAVEFCTDAEASWFVRETNKSPLMRAECFAPRHVRVVAR